MYIYIYKEKNKDNSKGAKVFYIDDPRMPHPRQLISRNYHHIENDPILTQLFPRENLVASCRRLPNLGEILSPTTQPSQPRGPSRQESGSYYCEKFKKGKSCDACKHLHAGCSTLAVQPIFVASGLAPRVHATRATQTV